MYLNDASKMCIIAAKYLEHAGMVNTGTVKGIKLKRQRLTEARANLNAALARIDSADSELDSEEDVANGRNS